MKPCEYCGSPDHEIHEVIYNLMVGWKKTYNNHVRGDKCWCKPTLHGGFLIHHNYEHYEDGTRFGNWRPIKEPIP